MDATLPVNGGTNAYQIFLRHNAEPECAERLMGQCHGGKLVVISDERVSRLYANDFVESIVNRGVDAHLLVMPEGEHAKTLDTAKDLYAKLLRLGADRDTVLVGFGGGVVGDVAGFVAATYMRGIPFVQVPTTLLAQVDSSVGGKVGLNLSQGKNLIGAFYEPKLVWIDSAYLSTLSPKEIRNGFAEVIKHSLIGEPDLLTRIENEIESLTAGDPHAWRKLLPLALQVKIDIVEQDFRENGPRRALNFGHTLAHAIEASGGSVHFNHGEAVSLGIRAMVRLSTRQGILPNATALRIEKILDEIGFPQLKSEMLRDQTLDFIRMDKKKSGENYRLIFLKSLGEIEERNLSWSEIKILFGALREDPMLET